MSEAQELGLTTSATNVFGFGETERHRILHMERIRDLQDTTKNFLFEIILFFLKKNLKKIMIHFFQMRKLN